MNKENDNKETSPTSETEDYISSWRNFIAKEAEKSGIKPCPFCGNLAKAVDWSEDGKIKSLFWVRCSKCVAESGLSRTVKEAVERWNQRACLNASCQQVKKEEGNGHTKSGCV